jgi:hypothetical protein
MIPSPKNAPPARPPVPAPPGEKTLGQAMVEFALMLPLVIMLAVGLLEFGMLFKDHVAIHYASREGARVGAAASRVPTADCSILAAISTTLQTVPYDDVVQAIIYRVDPNTNGECLLENGACPRMRYARLSEIGNMSQCDPPRSWSLLPVTGGDVDWPPDGSPGRNNDDTNPDSIGVTVEFNHRFFFNYVPGADSTSVIIRDTTITQIEPARFRPIPTPTPTP